jgi:hypothetical protein
VDPLVLLDQAVAQEKIPRTMATKVRKRMNLVQEAVQRVEKASGLRYPPYYVEPTLPCSKTGAEYGQMGVMFARVIPTTVTGSVVILVQFSSALVAFGTKGTIQAVAAHEFTHYVDLVGKLSTKNITSDEVVTTLFEASFKDAEHTVPAKLLFSERALVSLINRKFKDDLVDASLTKKAGDQWIAKNLPIHWVSPEENTLKVPMAIIAASRFDPAVLAKLQEMQKASS